MKKLIKSYGFWTALAGAVVVLLEAIGKLFGFSIAGENISDLIMAIAGILVVFGIVNIPRESENTEEEKKDENSENEEK